MPPTQVPNTPLPAAVTRPEAEKVIAALEDPRYKWRTYSGVATDTGLSEEKVHTIIDYLQSTGEVIQSSVNAKDGSELFATAHALPAAGLPLESVPGGGEEPSDLKE